MPPLSSTAPLHPSTRVDAMVQACAFIGLEFVALAPKSSAWAWDGCTYWRVHTTPAAAGLGVTGTAVDKDGECLGETRHRDQFSLVGHITVAEATAPDRGVDLRGGSVAECTPGGGQDEQLPFDCADNTDDAEDLASGGGTQNSLLDRVRLWYMTVVRDKYYPHTIVAADITRIVESTDNARDAVAAFDEYAYHVPGDIGSRIRAVLAWVPWEESPPVVAVIRADVPDDLYGEITEAARRHHSNS